jgi:leucyl/phenylalanyl-tRNA---protein transferase
LKISRSMRQVLNSGRFSVTMDTSFTEVIEACSAVERKGQDGTWINTDMIRAYTKLHREGHAHSVEVWLDDELAGGFYGVQVNHVFCGESMFSRVSNASKTALIWLCQSGMYQLIDCQLHTTHLESMGARLISRAEFESWLRE